MVPTRPGANLVVGQTGFTLAALNALFDAVLGFGNASEFLARCVGGAIGQVIVVLQRARWFGRACDNQRLFGANPFTVGLGDDARHGHFDDQRSMMSIANVDPHPSLRGKCRGPMTDLLERTFALS